MFQTVNLNISKSNEQVIQGYFEVQQKSNLISMSWSGGQYLMVHMSLQGAVPREKSSGL